MQAIHRVAKNTGILYMRMAITVFISLYSTRLILGALGVEDFGIYALVGGMISMLGFLNSSMAAATQRFMSYAQGAGDIDKVKHIFNMSTLLHIGIALLMVLVLEGMGYFFFDGLLNISEERLPAAKIVYQFMVISTFFTIISVPYEAVITSHENMLFFAVLGIVEAILKLAIALYISYGTLELPSELNLTTESINITYSAYDNLIIYGFLMAILAVFMLMIRRVYCHKRYTECEFNLRKYYDKDLLKEITHFAGWSFLGSASSMISHYGQGIVINMFFGTKANAAQGIAAQVSGQLGAFSTTMMRALNPMIAKSEGAGDRQLMLKASMMGSKLSFFLLMAFSIPFMIETPYILNLWLKDVPDYAVIFCRLLLMKSLIEQLYLPLSSAISAEGNIKGYQISLFILTVLPLPITYYLYSLNYPVHTLYLVFIAYTLLMLLLVLFYAKKNCQLAIWTFINNVMLRCGVVFTIVFCLSASLLYYMPSSLPRLISVITLTAVSYFINVYYIGFTKKERDRIKESFYLLINKIGLTKPASLESK